LGESTSKNERPIQYYNMLYMYRIIPRAPHMLHNIVDILHVHHQKLLANYLSA